MLNSAALAVHGLRKAYKDVVAIDGLDLEVREGECFGLLGPNGAGKTTTIEICEGLLEPDAGEVVVLGRRWATEGRALRERLGIQLQETELTPLLTVEETLRLFRSFYPRGRTVDDVISMVQLEEKRHARIAKLSGGQKQRLSVACALVGDPELLFLDEPTTGLDPQSRRQLWELVEQYRAGGRTIVLTTHYMEEAEHLCDRVAVVDHGRVIALGTPKSLIESLGGDHVIAFAAAEVAGVGAAAGSATSSGAAIDEAMLRAIDGVTDVRLQDGTYRLQTTALHRSVPQLLSELERRGIGLGALHTHSATLEDVFVKLTGRHLRDEA